MKANLIVFLLMFGMVSPGQASATTAGDIIPEGYKQIAQQYGFPAHVYFAIARVESGRRVQGRYLPWPWTLNVDGRPYYLNSYATACMTARHYIDRGSKVAIGLMQIYWPSHKKRFGDPCYVLQPDINLHAGAQILFEEWQSTGSLWSAIGLYHSRTKKYQVEYRNRVFGQLDAMGYVQRGPVG